MDTLSYQDKIMLAFKIKIFCTSVLNCNENDTL